jgi:hypothetical protein
MTRIVTESVPSPPDMRAGFSLQGDDVWAGYGKGVIENFTEGNDNGLN